MRYRNYFAFVLLAILLNATFGAIAEPAAGQAGKAEPTAAKPTPVDPTSAAAALPTVSATLETEPVATPEDSADDACIWVDPKDPAQSLIIGTNKKAGLDVYGLDGKRLQSIGDGRPNNVDLRYDFPMKSGAADLVASDDRATKTLRLHRVNPATHRLEDVGARPIAVTFEPYGLCMYRSAATGKYYVILNSPVGEVQQWLLKATDDDKVDAELVRSFAVGSQTEGCAADDVLGFLYIAEENVGIWKYGAEPDAGEKRTSVDAIENGRLTAGIEGLTIYYAPNKKGYLLASSQGSDRYAVYKREGDNAYIGSFAVGAGNGVDAVTGTDGIDVTNAALGPAFPKGLFVTQDDKNDPEHQNFKLVPWEKIAGLFTPALATTTDVDPRNFF